MTAPRATTIFDTEARIISIGEEQGGVWSALLLAPDIAQMAKPMQFVQVKVGTGTDPFLRRPFGISRIDRDSGLFGISWAVVGKGTSLMTDWKADDTVTVLGPLGNGLEPSPKAAGHTSVWLIAGGTGLAPLYPLAQSYRELGYDICVFYGARSADLLMDMSRFEELGCRVVICTEDGSEGTKSFVTAALEEQLSGTRQNAGARTSATSKGAPPGSPEPQSRSCCERLASVAVACGPTPMLQSVKALFAGTNVDLYVSLEGRMACGTGLCKGCAVKAASPRGGYLHVCSDGPVFSAKDVLLGGEN